MGMRVAVAGVAAVAGVVVAVAGGVDEGCAMMIIRGVKRVDTHR